MQTDRQQWNYFSKHVRQRWNNPKFFFLPPFLSWCVCWISQIGANYDLDRGWRNAQTASCAFCLSSHPIWKHPGNSRAALTTPASIFQIIAKKTLECVPSYYLLHLVHTVIKSCWKLACGVHTVDSKRFFKQNAIDPRKPVCHTEDNSTAFYCPVKSSNSTHDVLRQ